MGRACWTASADGWYAIDISLGPIAESLRVDTGIVDWRQMIGFDLESDLWDRLLNAGLFKEFKRRSSRDSSGRKRLSDSGRLAVRLLDPATTLPIGPPVEVFALRGARGVPSRVGVVFFHTLTGCFVTWNLDSRTWCVDYP